MVSFKPLLSYLLMTVFVCSSVVLLIKNNRFDYVIFKALGLKVLKKSLPSPKLFILKDAVKDGAVCLDGSPPGFYWQKGFGDGVDKWIIHFNGGAWCYDEVACYQRSLTELGSTKYSGNWVNTGGMYSSNKTINPDFYNWNFVWIIYCDGSSWTGMRADAVHYQQSTLYFRGKLILTHIIKNLMKKGLKNAPEVILTGSSAGSLAVLINADYIKSLLSPHTKLAAVSDSGYFVDLEAGNGDHVIRKKYQQLIKTHHSNLHHECVKETSLDERWKCMFPQYFLKYIKTPVFIVQSAYDAWQIVNCLQVLCNIPKYPMLQEVFTGAKRVPKITKEPWRWQGLAGAFPECTKSDMEKILSLRNKTLEALVPVFDKKGSGLFLSPCFEHTQAIYTILWQEIGIKFTNLQQAIHRWYFATPGIDYYVEHDGGFYKCK